MRIRLTLHHTPKQVLPINYQYLISSWIYRTLSNADADYATQLHNFGYRFRGSQFKLFSFGKLQPKWFDIDKRERTFILATSPTTLELSFFVEEAVQHFVIGLFQDQQFSLTSGKYRADFKVSQVDVLPRPDFQSTMRFRAVTPICISRKEEGKEHAQYLAPEQDGYGQLLVQNLLRKQQAVLQSVEQDDYTEVPFEFKLLSKSNPKLLRIKGTDVKAYLYGFELTLDKELLELGYLGGFGEKNSSLGLGLVETIH